MRPALIFALLLALTALCSCSPDAPEPEAGDIPVGSAALPDPEPSPGSEPSGTGESPEPLGPDMIDWTIEGLGTVRFTLVEAKMCKTLDEAGVYASSSRASIYDNYLFVSMKVRRLEDWGDLGDVEYTCSAEDFTMFSPNYDHPESSINYSPDLSGLAGEVDYHNYDYPLPPMGGEAELEVIFGVTNWTLDEINKNGTLWLANTSASAFLMLFSDNM